MEEDVDIIKKSFLRFEVFSRKVDSQQQDDYQLTVQKNIFRHASQYHVSG